MRDKLREYAAEGAEWPLAACILDPVRASVVCRGPAQAPKKTHKLLLLLLLLVLVLLLLLLHILE